jgi:hypothetical protein
VDLSPSNYNFELVGTDHATGGNACYVLALRPRKQNRFLYEGKIWVDAHDFAVVHMEGEPNRSPSFWIRDTEIDSRWEKIGSFWFIAHNRSISRIRMGGTATLTIDYGYYQITNEDRQAIGTQAEDPVLPDPASVSPDR